MKESRRSSQAGDIRAPERRYAACLPQRGRQRGGGFAAQKGSQPRLVALGSPFQWKGLAWTLPPSYGRRCPEGAEVGWGKRDEKERERSSQVRRLREHPIHRCAVPLPQWGKATKREYRFSRIVRANTRICGKKNNDGQSLTLKGKVASEVSRIGHWRYERQMRKTEKCVAHVWKA